MERESEIPYLLDLMPASGRMLAKIVSQPQQAKVIDAPFPPPWRWDSRPININFELWSQLSRGERDLLLLRAASSITAIRWFQPDIYQGAVVVSLAGFAVEAVQVDAIGMLVAGGLAALAANQVWRNNRSLQRELAADESAIKIAQRRSYGESEAARNLLSGIETVARLEGRPSLNFTELIRSQHLKAIAGLSPVGVPNSVYNKK